jgi:uncharacterized RDD family membrane protein YckC
MDVHGSVPPPSAPAASPPREPVGDLKKLDGKRVLARIVDGLIIAVPAAVFAAVQDDAAFLVFTALGLIYFFVCEAALSQTPGKMVMGLRVMMRDGSAPTVNAVSARTVLRLIDDNLLGLIVMVLSGKRRQRIGDLLAGTTVGPAVGPVPRPASSPLLAIYPASWIIGALIYITVPLLAGPEAEYREHAQSICRQARELPPGDLSAVLPVMVQIHEAHAKLSPPDDLTDIHSELLRSERATVENGAKMLRARDAGNRRQLRALIAREARSLEQRNRIVGPHLPDCAAAA